MHVGGRVGKRYPSEVYQRIGGDRKRVVEREQTTGNTGRSEGDLNIDGKRECDGGILGMDRAGGLKGVHRLAGLHISH